LSEVTLQPAAGKSILFIVPAHERVELARICYLQFVYLISKLRGRGLYADVLVIADDENLETADDHCLRILAHDNRLGAKLNAGYRYAHEHGFDYVCAIGNDSWMHPDRLTWLPVGDAILCTRNFTCLNAEANEQAALRLDYPGGVGSRVFPTGMFERVDYAPLDPYQMSGCDTGTLLALCRNVERAPDLVYTDHHPAEVVGFQSGDVQVTKWHWWLQHPHDKQAPFHGLTDLYGPELVDAIRAHYAAVAA
jgi:hypothetical protein